jgi:hypothetical protein
MNMVVTPIWIKFDKNRYKLIYSILRKESDTMLVTYVDKISDLLIAMHKKTSFQFWINDIKTFLRDSSYRSIFGDFTVHDSDTYIAEKCVTKMIDKWYGYRSTLDFNSFQTEKIILSKNK